MTRALLADENVDRRIVRELVRLRPALDILSVQQAGLAGVSDPLVLAWAAEAGRVLLTHDFRTMIRDAYERIRQGLPMPGLIAVRSGTLPRQAAEEVLMIIECSLEAELLAQVRFVPL